jgi:hypothetical protein
VVATTFAIDTLGHRNWYLDCFTPALAKFLVKDFVTDSGQLFAMILPEEVVEAKVAR